MNCIARFVSAALATVSACSCVPTCDSTSETSGLLEVNFASSAPGFTPGTAHSSSPVCAVPFSWPLPETSHAPTSTEAEGLRKFATGRNVFTCSPKVNSASSLLGICGRSKCSSLPSMKNMYPSRSAICRRNSKSVWLAWKRNIFTGDGAPARVFGVRP